MYIPKQFAEERVEVMHELMAAHPLATLVSHSTGGLNANHIPLHLCVEPAPYGALQGHIARGNPLLDEMGEGREVLAIFHGPNAYISPSWYATKQQTGKVVPTWNYAVVHAYGYLRVIEDAAWLRAQLDALTTHNESGQPDPWSISDAPAEYIEQLMSAVVGVEMVITKLLGKWKVSQNQPQQNQIAVSEGLQASGHSDSLAMASLVAGVNKAR